MADFSKSVTEADSLLAKGKLVDQGKTLAEANVDARWIVAYGMIAERVDRDRRYGLSRYPYEAGAAIGVLTGGVFDHREWPLRKELERHSSLRSVSEYEAKYVNAAGYWNSFHTAAISLR